MRDHTPEELKSRVVAISPVRREKVEETKRRMQSGTYKIDATAVARSLLKEQLLDDLLRTG